MTKKELISREQAFKMRGSVIDNHLNIESLLDDLTSIFFFKGPETTFIIDVLYHIRGSQKIEVFKNLYRSDYDVLKDKLWRVNSIRHIFAHGHFLRFYDSPEKLNQLILKKFELSNNAREKYDIHKLYEEFSTKAEAIVDHLNKLCTKMIDLNEERA